MPDRDLIDSKDTTEQPPTGQLRPTSSTGLPALALSTYKDLGQHMTPPAVATQMISQVKHDPNSWIVLDPACGNGNLLLSCVDAMERAGVPDIVDRICGIDVDPEMIRLARERLANRLACDRNSIQVIEGDFPNLVEGSLFNLTELMRLRRANLIVANPPYGQGREYLFFDTCARFFEPGTELVFLVPLAFMDRTFVDEMVALRGRPLGVTTGHAIVHHTVGHKYEIRPVKTHQSNQTNFSVLSGIKLYELGAGIPPQTARILATKPYSSPRPIPGWIPCLRTGDITAYQYRLGRLFINYGQHLAHPKDLSRFSGPRLFVRRVPVWKDRQIGATYIEETAVCAGDVLVIKHGDNNAELLKGLCVLLNSTEAAEALLQRRPTVRYRDSFPKLSAKDLNAFLDILCPTDEKLRELCKGYRFKQDHNADF